MALEPWLFHCVPENGELAVDIGANRGEWAFFLAERFNRVIAVEPNPAMAGLILNQLQPGDNITLVGCLAGAGTDPPLGTLYLFDDRPELSCESPMRDDAGKHSTAVLVGRLTTDVILQRLGQETPADFIKIDVEGGELSVLEGLRGHFVTQDHPRRLLVEVHSEDLGQQCRQFLTQYQYEVTEMRHPGYVYDSPNWRMHYWLLAVREPKGNPS